MIIEQGFERLYTGFGTDRVDTGELLEQSRVISRNWKSDIVNNENKVNFSLDSDLKFHYLTETGQEKQSDITNSHLASCVRV